MTLSITLTCLVYMIILGPTSEDGLIGAYLHNYAGSLGVHLIGPVFAIADFLMFDKGFETKKIYAIYAVIPPLCYVAFVYILAALGVRWYDTMTAPYNFLNYAAPTGWFGWDLSQMGSESLGIGVVYMIVVLLLIFIGIGLLYLAINGAGRGVKEQQTEFAPLPAKFEAGTQNVGGAAGLTAAIEYLEQVGFDYIEQVEKDLVNYALPKLKAMPYIELYGCDSTLDNKTGIITFNVKDVHPHDVATILDAQGVAIRAGHHCAQPLMQYLGQNATCRASFYFYNTREDVDRWLEALSKVRGVLGYAE